MVRAISNKSRATICFVVCSRLDLHLFRNIIIGSALSLGGVVASLFKQVGIYDEFVELGKKVTHTYAYKEDLKFDFALDYTARTTM